MGYTTEFKGNFGLNKKLSPELNKFLIDFSYSRRMGRKMVGFGVDGEFYVEDDSVLVINYNQPPRTQPSLWCNWIPIQNGTAIEWNGRENFYYYVEWLIYLIEKILKPNGYILNGTVKYRGEEFDDIGEIFVDSNTVFLNDTIVMVSEPKTRLDVVYKPILKTVKTKTDKSVSVSLSTNVIVNANATNEDIIEAAKAKLSETSSNEYEMIIDGIKIKL